MTCPSSSTGAGPAGLTAAISLARLGVETMLVERRPELSSLPRATAVSLRSMELLRLWGLEDAVRAGGVDVEWRGWRSGTLATADRGSAWPVGLPTREQAAVLSPTAPACVPQDHLEPVLLEHLRSLGGTRVHLHTEVVGVEDLHDGVEVTLRDLATGDLGTVRARYLVAADGAHSRIRAAAGIAMRGPDGLGHVVTALFRAPLWAVLGERRHGIYSVDDPQGAGTFLPAGRGDRWIYGTWVEPEDGRRATRPSASSAGSARGPASRTSTSPSSAPAPSASPPSWRTASAPGTSSSPGTPRTGSRRAAAPG